MGGTAKEKRTSSFPLREREKQNVPDVVWPWAGPGAGSFVRNFFDMGTADRYDNSV
jgi:hypothetical protein